MKWICFFLNPQTGEYKFDHNKLQETHEWCLERTLSALSFIECGMKRWVFVGNTFVSAKELVGYYFPAENFATVFVLDCGGNYESIHKVPKKTIDRMRRRFIATEYLFDVERKVKIGDYELKLIRGIHKDLK